MIVWKNTGFMSLLVIFCTILGCNGKIGQTCDISSVDAGCGVNERCVESKQNDTAFCVCRRNFYQLSGSCIEISTTAAASTDPTNQRNDEESSGSSVAVGLLVPTFLLLFGGLGFCVIRRYRLLPCRQNLYGNVLVTREEDDDDDPPIA